MSGVPVNKARPLAKDFSIFLNLIALPDPVENIPQLTASSGARVDVGICSVGPFSIRSTAFDVLSLRTSFHPLVAEKMCFFQDAEII
jgi:hypothetical protein